MASPVLHVFAISHYCEKARWALAHLGVEHRLQVMLPGWHMRAARRLGAARSALPILVAGDATIQGSAAILDWADRAADAGRERLCPDALRDECEAIEARLDRVVGVHVRRGYYSEALVEYPDTVRVVFARDLPWPQRVLLRGAWPIVRGLMIRGMDLGTVQGRASMRIVDEELGWIDGLLADGRGYLVGGRFTRADIAAASLLAPLVLPPEHPVYAGMQWPPRLAEALARWAGRRSLQWVRRVYARHR